MAPRNRGHGGPCEGAGGKRPAPGNRLHHPCIGRYGPDQALILSPIKGSGGLHPPAGQRPRLLTDNLDAILHMPGVLAGQEELDGFDREHLKIPENRLTVTLLRKEAQNAQMRIYDVKRRAKQCASRSVAPGRPENQGAANIGTNLPMFIY